MGWDLHRFVDQGSIVQDVICSICTDVVQEPVQTPCDHVFCSECIIRWLEEDRRTCPIDRQPLTFEALKPPNRVITQLINKLTIRCKFFDKGCRLMCKLEDILHLIEHEQNGCPFAAPEPSGSKKEVETLKRQNSELSVEKNLRVMALEEKEKMIHEKNSTISDLEKKILENKRAHQDVWRAFQGKIEQLAEITRRNVVDDNRVPGSLSRSRSSSVHSAAGACQLSHICMSDHEAGASHVFAAPKCLRGHTMIIDAAMGFTCDLCFSKKEREPRWRCDQCDDDFCFNCYPI